MIAIVIRENGADAYHYVYSDHLGSLLTITNSAGSVEVEQNFDTWGRRRNPTRWDYIGLPTPPDWLYQGYTGHEMLDPFVLINMNGRIYDPVVACVLSPDNYVQDPFSTQGYNRYSYGYNNPLKYTDPDGQIIPLVFLAAAVIGGGLNVAAHWGKIHSLQDGLIAFGIGAGAGLLTAATGGAAATTAGLAAASIGGGAVAGAVGAAFGGALQGIGNALYFGDSFGAREWLTGIALGAGSGAALGGIAGWIRNLRNPASGHNLWTGAPQAEGTSVFSFRNGRELLEQGWQRVDGRWWNSLGGGDLTFQQSITETGQINTSAWGYNQGDIVARLEQYNINAESSNTALRTVGSVLESIEDVMANPNLLQGKPYGYVRNILGNSENWINDVMRRSTRANGWVLREMNQTGTDFTGRMIQYHPGTPRHYGGAPYWKVSTGNTIFRVPTK